LRQLKEWKKRHGFRMSVGIMSKRRRMSPVQSDNNLEQQVQQAQRLRRRGDQRKALVLLREACFRAGSDARLWALYAMQCWRMGRADDARQAFRQALWFRERAGDAGRTRVLRALLNAAELRCCPDALKAA